jgi:hypothetical protein
MRERNSEARQCQTDRIRVRASPNLTPKLSGGQNWESDPFAKFDRLEAEIKSLLCGQIMCRLAVDGEHGVFCVPIIWLIVTPLLEPAFDTTLTTGRTVYDSIYLLLAVALGCNLVTADLKLCNALRASMFAADVSWVADAI